MSKSGFWVLLGLLGAVFGLSAVAATFCTFNWYRHPARRGAFAFTLEARTSEAVRAVAEDRAMALEEALRARGGSALHVAATAEGSVAIEGLLPDAAPALARALADTPFHREPDEGAVVRLRLSPSYARSIEQEALGQSKAVLERRLRALGVPGPRVSAGAGGRIRVEVPAARELEASRRVLTLGGMLALKPVEDGPAPRDELLARYGDQLPFDRTVACSTGPEPECFLVNRAAVITGRDVERARPALDAGNSPSVHVTLTPAGAATMKRFTGRNVGRRLAILLDGALIVAPLIQGEIGGDAQITGRFTAGEANEIAVTLQAGALPVPLTFVAEERIPSAPWLLPYWILGGPNLAVAAVTAVGMLLVVWKRPRTGHAP